VYHLVTEYNLHNMGPPPGGVLQVSSEDLGTVSDIGVGNDGTCPVCSKTYKGKRGVGMHW